MRGQRVRPWPESRRAESATGHAGPGRSRPTGRIQSRVPPSRTVTRAGQVRERSEVGVESELEAEQEFVDMAYGRLDAMRSDANSMLEGVLDLGRGGTFQSRTERDVIVRTSLARLEQLDIGDQALTFGRIDRVEEARATGTFHIGRLAIHSADHEPL